MVRVYSAVVPQLREAQDAWSSGNDAHGSPFAVKCATPDPTRMGPRPHSRPARVRVMVASMVRGLAIGGATGLAVGIVVSVLTDVPFAPEIGLLLGLLIGWLLTGRTGMRESR